MNGLHEAIVDSMKVSPRDVLFIFFSKLHIMVGVFLLVVSVVAVKTLRTSPVYKVSAAILIRPIVDSRLTLQSSRFSVAPVSQEDVNTEIKLMSSKDIMREVAHRMGRLKKKKQATDTPPKKKSLLVKLGIEFEASREDKIISAIRSGFDISAVGMSNMIQVSKEGEDPAEITEVLRVFLDCYIDRHIEAHKTAGSVQFHTQQVKFYEKRIFELEEQLKRYEEGYFIINPDQQLSSYLKLIQLLEYDLDKLQIDIAERQKKVDVFKEDMEHHAKMTLRNEDYRNNQVLTELTKVYIPLLLEKERIRSLYLKSSPEYKDTLRQIKLLKSEILKEQKQFLDGMELDLQALINKKQVLAEEIQQIKTKAIDFKKKEIVRSRLVEKISLYKRNHDIYGEKLEEARITEEREKARAANVFVSNWPSKPSKPDFPNVKARLLLSLPAGIIAAIGAALVAFYLDHTVKRPEDLNRLTGTHMLSSLGIVRDR
jgi:uncharacterized protein involved in exopolysaccharide biosynthesis